MSSRMPFVNPLALDRFLMASLFARRICSGEATEASETLHEFQQDSIRDG